MVKFSDFHTFIFFIKSNPLDSRGRQSVPRILQKWRENESGVQGVNAEVILLVKYVYVLIEYETTWY